MKDVGIRIRVQRELRDHFLEACRADEKPAAQVLREFMRAYIAENKTKIDASQDLQGGNQSSGHGNSPDKAKRKR